MIYRTLAFYGCALCWTIQIRLREKIALLIHGFEHLIFVQLVPEKFVEIMKLMEHRYGAKDFTTNKDCSLLPPGTYYLTEVDSLYRRFYAKKDGECEKLDNGVVANGH